MQRRRFLQGAATGSALALAGCTAPAISERDSGRWDQTVDVLVAGSGAAATSAAIDAHRTGVSTLVLEKLTVIGGSSAMSGGVIYLGGGTPLQKVCGFEDSRQAMYDYIANASHLHPQLDKIARYCDGSLEHFDWLVGNGVPFVPRFSNVREMTFGDESLYYSGSEKAWPYRDLARPAPRGHVPSREGLKGVNGGRVLMQALHASARAQGIRFVTDAKVQRLVVGDDGAVLGVQALIAGELRRIRARGGVVLACGGFIHNRAMVREHAPELYDCSTPWANMGDMGEGIQMGVSVGAGTLRMDQGFSIVPIYPPNQVVKGIVVNRSGQRFINEDVYHARLGDAIAYHEQGKAWLICDADSAYGYDDYRVKVVAQADTVAELGRALKFPDAVLEQTVQYYNRFAAQKQDPMFHKQEEYLSPLQKAPFVAYDLSVDKAFFVAHTFGGLHTSVDTEVLNGFGEAIPGLYAAGRTSHGIPTSPYIGSGISVGDSLFFGRVAGRHAAGRVAA
ncbi:MAG TPA: FAD-dependent oxidoreductase [Spongiibacteraceae bacterium]|nr:FAD-dependent oxidoreductase [Spongiibacteraceae bacterium]